MSPFTEAHFAATLLECGPHIISWPERTGDGDAYFNRCYSYFFKLFPRKVDMPSEYANGTHEWLVFWREYLAWVGDKS